MRFRKSIWLILIIATVSVLAIVLIQTGQKKKLFSPIRFTGRDQVLANWIAILAQEKGFWQDEGVQVEYQNAVRGRDAAQALVAGQSDITTMSDFSFMLAIHHYQDLKMFGSIAQSSNSVMLVGDASLGIHDIQDIVGKNIALSIGSGSQFYFEDLLSQLQIPLKSVQIVNMEPQAIIAAAHRHEISVMATWQPYSQQIKDVLGTNAIVLSPRGVRPYLMTFDLVSHSVFLQQRSDDVRHFLNGLKRAQEFIVDHPAEAIEIYSKRTGLAPDVVHRIAADYTFSLTLPHQEILDTLKRQDKWAIAAGLTEQLLSDERWAFFIDSSFIQP